MVPTAEFATLLEAAPVPLCILDPRHDHRVVDANALWLTLLGRTREQVLGRNGPEIGLWIGRDDLERLGTAIRDCPSQTEQELCIDCAGRPRWFRISARHTRIGALGWVVLAMQDIQAQRELEQHLRDSEAVSRHVFDVVPEALLISDSRSGEFIDINAAWAERIGYTKEQVLGRTSRQIQLWVDLKSVAEMGARFAREGQLDGEFQQMRRADGVARSFEISARQWQASDRPLSIWLARDVTEQRQARQALEELNATLEQRVEQRTRELADALDVVRHTQEELVRTERLSSLGALVAGVAHELNTPIGNTLLAASTLQDLSREFALQRERGLTRSGLQRFCTTIDEITEILTANMDRAVRLINGFKQLAVDQSSYQRREFELAGVIDEVLMTLRPSLRRLPVEIEVAVADDLRLDSYPGPLGQVLINLVNNALQHGFEARGGGRIDISAEPSGPGWLRLRVSDDGCGIPPTHLQRVFDPFFTTKLGQGGSGLGLHISFSLVNGLLGGSIEAGASDSGGAAFTLRLPCVAPPPAGDETRSR